MSVLTFSILIIIGILAGILSGVVGIGGGLIIIPLLIFFLGLSQHEAQGTSLAIMLPPIGILAVMNYYKSGFVKWEYAIIIATAFVIGGYFGSKYVVILKPEIMRRVFGIVMLIAGVKILFSK